METHSMFWAVADALSMPIHVDDQKGTITGEITREVMFEGMPVPVKLKIDRHVETSSGHTYLLCRSMGDMVLIVDVYRIMSRVDIDLYVCEYSKLCNTGALQMFSGSDEKFKQSARTLRIRMKPACRRSFRRSGYDDWVETNVDDMDGSRRDNHRDDNRGHAKAVSAGSAAASDRPGDYGSDWRDG